MRQVEKSVLLQLFDQSWKEHLLHLDHLRQGIGLRAYGQQDPLNEYKREAFNLFNDLLTGLREQVVERAGARCSCAWSSRRCRRCRRRHAGDPRGSGAGRAGMSDDPAFDPADPDGGGVRHAAPAARRRPGAKSIPTIPRPGARSRATRPAPAARARSSSTATGGSDVCHPAVRTFTQFVIHALAAQFVAHRAIS